MQLLPLLSIGEEGGTWRTKCFLTRLPYAAHACSTCMVCSSEGPFPWSVRLLKAEVPPLALLLLSSKEAGEGQLNRVMHKKSCKSVIARVRGS